MEMDFQTVRKKEENRQLQWQVMNMASRQKQKESVMLVENYYHELAIDCISEHLGQEKSIYGRVRNFERRGPENRKKNFMRHCTGISG